MRVLVTRPAHQQTTMVKGCRNLGFTPVCLPTIDILPTEATIDPDIVDAADLVLFTSYNAVQFAHLNTPLPWRSNNVECIGPATEKAVVHYNQTLQQKPVPPFTSEAYIRDLERRLSKNPERIKRAVIIKGEGGRQLIEDFFRKEKVQLTTFSVYRRLCPVLDNEQRAEIFGENCPEIITAASDDGLKNLIQMVGAEHLDNVLNSQLIVNSERSARLATDFGFTSSAIVARPPGDKAQLTVLEDLLKV